MPDGATSIAEALSRRGRFEEEYEWRISTYTRRGIERVDHGYRAWSETDGTWEAVVEQEHEALAALFVLSGLQHRLFYAIGWPSWASATQLRAETRAKSWSPSPRDACERYLVQLWLDDRARAKSVTPEIVTAIAISGAWRSARASLRLTRPRDGADEADWIEAEVTAPGLRFVSASPTPSRAVEFAFIYERIATDLERVLGWHFVDGPKPTDRTL